MILVTLAIVIILHYKNEILYSTHSITKMHETEFY